MFKFCFENALKSLLRKFFTNQIFLPFDLSSTFFLENYNFNLFVELLLSKNSTLAGELMISIPA